jgi:hypothetical protein
MKSEERLDAGELQRNVALVELVNRVLARGAVITGEAVIRVAGVDLVYLGLQIVVSSVEAMRGRGVGPPDG